MTPGTTTVYQCSNCENLILGRSLNSGNTFNAKHFSDGKRIAPMLPEFPILTICSNCKNIFWIEDAKVVAEFDGRMPNKWDYAEEARFLSIEEYFKALDNNLYKSIEDELFIRLRIWWTFNDRVRNKDELFNSENDKSVWYSNAIRLFELFDENNTNQKIMTAELHRNMGDFEKCLEIIMSIEDDRLNWLKTAFEKECKEQNVKVFQLSS